MSSRPRSPTHDVSQWLKIAAAIVPLLLGALVKIAWDNSRAMAVLTNRVEHNEKQIDRLRDMMERPAR